MMIGNGVIGVLKEDRYKWERRAPLTPAHCAKLLRMGAPPGKPPLRIIVQPCTKRIHTDLQYQEVGCEISDDLSECGLIIGVKQAQVGTLQAERAYMFFSHTHKAQPDNMPLLDEVLEKRVTLYDYELIVGSTGKRQVAFGEFAGRAGMIDFLRGLGERCLSLGLSTPLLALGSAYMYTSLSAAKAAVLAVGDQISAVGLPAAVAPLVFVFTGTGNVSKGAQEVFRLLPHQYVEPHALPHLLQAFALAAQNGVGAGGDHTTTAGKWGRPLHQVYGCVVTAEHMVAPLDPGGTFDKEEYYARPELYTPIFHRTVAPYASAIVNCMYWERRYPRLLTNSQLRHLATAPAASEHGGGASCRLLGVADITCDVGGSIECLHRTTDIERPFVRYNPIAETHHDDMEGPGVVILAVDILPTELAKESTKHFGDALSPFLGHLAFARVPEDAPGPLTRACIAHGGQLAPLYEYIHRMREAQQTIVPLEGTGNDHTAPVDSFTTLVSLDGHLFDQFLINEALDVIETAGGNFQLATWRVGKNSHVTSYVELEVSADSAEQLARIVESLAAIATHSAPPPRGAAPPAPGSSRHGDSPPLIVGSPPGQVIALNRSSSSGISRKSPLGSPKKTPPLDQMGNEAGARKGAETDEGAKADNGSKGGDDAKVAARVTEMAAAAGAEQGRGLKRSPVSALTQSLAQQKARQEKEQEQEQEREMANGEQESSAPAAAADAVAEVAAAAAAAGGEAGARLEAAAAAAAAAASGAANGKIPPSLLLQQPLRQSVLILGAGRMCEPIVRHLAATGTGAWPTGQQGAAAAAAAPAAAGAAGVAGTAARAPAAVEHKAAAGAGAVGGARGEPVSITVASLFLADALKVAAVVPGVLAAQVDTSDTPALESLVAQADVVISMLPPFCHVAVAEACIQHKKHLVTASYVSVDMDALHARAQAAGVTLLCEMGLDPGIDHMSAMRMIDRVHSAGGRVESFVSSGGGLPAPAAANNPLAYKFSWNPRGALLASRNAATFRRNGRTLHVAGEDLLSSAEPVRMRHLPAFALERLPNRDALSYGHLYGIDHEAHTVFRATLRYQGFSEIMAAIAAAGLFDTCPLPPLRRSSPPSAATRAENNPCANGHPHEDADTGAHAGADDPRAGDAHQDAHSPAEAGGACSCACAGAGAGGGAGAGACAGSAPPPSSSSSSRKQAASSSSSASPPSSSSSSSGAEASEERGKSTPAQEEQQQQQQPLPTFCEVLNMVVDSNGHSDTRSDVDAITGCHLLPASKPEEQAASTARKNGGSLSRHRLPDGDHPRGQQADVLLRLKEKLIQCHMDADVAARAVDCLRWLGMAEDKEVPPGVSCALDALCACMEARMQYAPDEQDMVLLHHELEVSYPDGRSRERHLSTLLAFGSSGGGIAGAADERRAPAATAMATTVGLPAAIGAQLLLSKRVKATGVVRPLAAEIYDPALQVLEALGVCCEEHIEIS